MYNIYYLYVILCYFSIIAWFLWFWKMHGYIESLYWLVTNERKITLPGIHDSQIFKHTYCTIFIICMLFCVNFPLLFDFYNLKICMIILDNYNDRSRTGQLSRRVFTIHFDLWEASADCFLESSRNPFPELSWHLCVAVQTISQSGWSSGKKLEFYPSNPGLTPAWVKITKKRSKTT